MSIRAISSKPIEFVPECEKGSPNPFTVIFKPLTKATADAWRATLQINPSEATLPQGMNLQDKKLWAGQVLEIKNFIFDNATEPEASIKGDLIGKVYDQIPREIGDEISLAILKAGFLSENERKNLPSQSGPENTHASTASPAS